MLVLFRNDQPFRKVTGRHVDEKFTHWGALINLQGLTQLYPIILNEGHKSSNYTQLRANHEKRHRKIKKRRSFAIYYAAQ